MSINDPTAEDAKTYAESYLTFSKTLRTWLVAYGIGAPVLLASQDAFSNIFESKDAAMQIICAYLAGVCIQIFSVFLYKASMWYIMWGALKNNFKNTIRYRFSDWISEQLWIELLFDLASFLLFIWATVKVLTKFV